MQRRSGNDAVKVPVDVKMPALGSLDYTHFELCQQQKLTNADAPLYACENQRTGSDFGPKRALRTVKNGGHCAIYRPGASHTSFGPESSPTAHSGMPKLEITAKDAKTTNIKSAV